MNKSKGFTLIEIIVVLIILGMLAAISLTSYFSWIEKARASEAILTFKNSKVGLEACYSLHQSFRLLPDDTPSPCNTNFTQYANYANPPIHFSFDGPNVGNDNKTFQIVLQRRADVDPVTDPGGVMPACEQWANGGYVASGLSLCRHPDGSYTIAGWGLYAGI
jgi:prepilin-type N-terminal cleavage/methylation domain-containing protein